MAYKKVLAVQYWEILRRWADKQPNTTIAAQVGCDRKTVQTYIALARQELKLAASDITPERKDELLPRLQEVLDRAHARATSQLLLESHSQELLDLVNNPANPLKMKTAFGVIARRYDLVGKVSYSSFKRFAAAHNLAPTKRQRPTCRIETGPGEQTQIDYGKMGLLLDPREKRRRVVYAFIGTLSFSRHKFIQFVWSQNQASFVQSHVDMFDWFGGCTAVLTIDNLKDGVLKPDIYDPVLNRAYQDMAEHYGTHIDPCRVGASRDKGKVERDVQTARELFRQILAEHPGATLAECNRYAQDWLVQVYGTRKHGTTHEAPLVRFETQERQTLKALPASPYTIARWAQAVVHPDHYIQALGHRMSLSTEYIGKTVQVMVSAQLAKIYLDHQLIKIKPLEEGKTVYTDLEDFPASVQVALSEETPRRLIRQAFEAGGTPFKELVVGLLSVPGFSYLRRVMGLREAVKGYTFAIVERAARVALTLDKPVTTRLFKHMLESMRTEEQQSASCDGLPLSEETERFMRPASYFLPSERTGTNG